MKNQKKAHPFSAALLIVLLAGLGACATPANKNPQDPLEGFNRAMYSVNQGIDFVVKPVAQGYDAILPAPVKTGVGNFFSNIADLWIAVNNLLQGKGSDGISDIGRFLVNSTIGIVGLFDVASDLNLPKHSGDFGQTLGVWGVGEGVYLYLPIIGPRTARDTIGFGVDAFVDPVRYVDNIPVRNSLLGLRFLDKRARLFPAEKVLEQAAFDKYSYLRDAYLQNRRNAVRGDKFSEGSAVPETLDDPCKAGSGACN